VPAAPAPVPASAGLGDLFGSGPVSAPPRTCVVSGWVAWGGWVSVGVWWCSRCGTSEHVVDVRHGYVATAAVPAAAPAAAAAAPAGAAFDPFGASASTPAPAPAPAPAFGDLFSNNNAPPSTMPVAPAPAPAAAAPSFMPFAGAPAPAAQAATFGEFTGSSNTGAAPAPAPAPAAATVASATLDPDDVWSAGIVNLSLSSSKPAKKRNDPSKLKCTCACLALPCFALLCLGWLPRLRACACVPDLI